MVLWAQRPSMIILTFCVEDCKEPEIKLESDKLHFKGVGGPDKKLHELTIDFFKEVDTEVRIFNYFMMFQRLGLRQGLAFQHLILMI